MSFCGKCGNKADVGDAFCPSCGNRFSELGDLKGDADHGDFTKEDLLVEPLKPKASSSSQREGLSRSRTEMLKILRQDIGFHIGPREDKAVVDLVFGSVAKNAGIQWGDVIVAVGSIGVTNLSTFILAFDEIDLSRSFNLEIFREGQKLKLTVDPHYQPPRQALEPQRRAQSSSLSAKRKLRRSKGLFSLVVGFFMSLLLIIGGVYFGTYSEQNFVCNAANAFGEPTPLSCTWYQLAYGGREWILGLGIFLALLSGAALILSFASDL